MKNAAVDFGDSKNHISSNEQIWLAADIERLIEQIDFSVRLRAAIKAANELDQADGYTMTDDLTASMLENAVLTSCRDMLQDTLGFLQDAAKLRALTR